MNGRGHELALTLDVHNTHCIMKTFNVEFGKKEVYQFRADADTVKAKYGGSYSLVKHLKSVKDFLNQKDLVYQVDFEVTKEKTTMVITFYVITDPVIVEE